MPIAITPEHNDLADSVKSLVARVAPSEVLHEALENPIPNPPPYWRAAAEQGLHGVHLAESVDGQGFGLLELAIVIAEFGYGAVPGPFVPSAIASALISANDPDAKVLSQLASGDLIAAYALESELTATEQGDRLVIRGEARSVPAAAQASMLVLPVAIGQRRRMGGARRRPPGDRAGDSPSTCCGRSHTCAPTASRSAPTSCCPTSPSPPGRAIVTTLLSAEAIGIARWATDTAVGVRQDPRAVRPADRSVPGDQAQVRRDDRHHRACHRRGVGRRPRARRGCPRRTGTTRKPPTSSPRRWRPPWHRPPPSTARRTASRCTAASASPGSTTQRLLPPRARAGRLLRPVHRIPAAGVRHRDHHRHASGQHRPGPRDREAARRDPRRSRCAQGDSARRAQRPRSPRAAGCSRTCPSRGAARRARSSRSSSPRSSRPVR